MESLEAVLETVRERIGEVAVPTWGLPGRPDDNAIMTGRRADSGPRQVARSSARLTTGPDGCEPDEVETGPGVRTDGSTR